MSRPKKQKKTVQERKKAASERAQERKKKDDCMTYIMLGVVAVLFVAFLARMVFF